MNSQDILTFIRITDHAARYNLKIVPVEGCIELVSLRRSGEPYIYQVFYSVEEIETFLEGYEKGLMISALFPNIYGQQNVVDKVKPKV